MKAIVKAIMQVSSTAIARVIQQQKVMRKAIAKAIEKGQRQ